MSDTSEGPGWWQASDGKWYAPELYPADWPRPDSAAAEAAVPETSDAMASDTEAADQSSGPATSASATSDEVGGGGFDPESTLMWRPPEAETPDSVEVPAPESASAVADGLPEPSPPDPDPVPPEAPEAPAVDSAAEPVGPSAEELGWRSPETPPPVEDPTLVSGLSTIVTTVDPTAIQPAVPPGAGTAPPVPPPSAGTPAPPAVPPPSAPLPPPTGAPPPVPPPPAPAPAPPGAWNQPVGTPPVAAPGWAQPAVPSTTGRKPNVAAALLGLVGGGLLVIGSFLDWAEVTIDAGGTSTVNALSNASGGWTLACGAVLIVASILALVQPDLSWPGPVMIVAGIAAAGLFGFSWYDLGQPLLDRVAEALTEQGVSTRVVIERTVWLWLIAGGAAAGLLAGILALVQRN